MVLLWRVFLGLRSLIQFLIYFESQHTPKKPGTKLEPGFPRSNYLLPGHRDQEN